MKRRVARGDLVPGDRIPSQRELARQLKVNPNTIQRAYREMEASGFVETLRGQGTFVREDPNIVREIRMQMANEALTSFIGDMRALGFKLDDVVKLVKRAVEQS